MILYGTTSQSSSTLLAFVCTDAIAKCPYQKYTIYGEILEYTTGKPVPKASIFIFFDDYQGTMASVEWIYPDFFLTDVSGNFEAHSWFDTSTWSDLLFGCGKKPKEIEVVVTCENYRTKRTIFKLSSLSISIRNDEPIVRLPIIDLYPIKRRN